MDPAVLQGLLISSWFFSQLIILTGELGDTETRAILSIAVLCVLSIVAAAYGFRISGATPSLLAQHLVAADQYLSQVSRKRLRNTAAASTLVAVSADTLLGVMAPGAAGDEISGNWTGPITIVYAFANLKTASLFLALAYFFKRPSWLSILLVMVNAYLFLPAMLIHFRRRAIVEFVIILLCALFFFRKFVPSRLLSITIGAALVLATFSAGDIRSQLRDGTNIMVALGSVDLASNVPINNPRQAPEVRNALAYAYAASNISGFSLGGETWNRLVFQWVPAQIVGSELKQAIMVPGFERYSWQAPFAERRIGTTPTAIGEAFLEFGYFGWIFFFLTSLALGIWLKRALRGSFLHAALFAVALPGAVMMPSTYPSYMFVSIVLHYVWLTLLLRRFVFKRKPARSFGVS